MIAYCAKIVNCGEIAIIKGIDFDAFNYSTTIHSSRSISDCDASHPVRIAFLPVLSWVNMQIVPSA